MVNNQWFTHCLVSLVKCRFAWQEIDVMPLELQLVMSSLNHGNELTRSNRWSWPSFCLCMYTGLQVVGNSLLFGAISEENGECQLWNTDGTEALESIWEWMPQSIC